MCSQSLVGAGTSGNAVAGLRTLCSMNDEHFMRAALHEAELASQSGEVPVGAVVVQQQQIIGRGFNRSRTLHDPSAHAEVVALRDAGRAIGNHRLSSAILYVTIEPCLMCCGALLNARLQRLVYGAREPKTGAVVSVYDSLMQPGLNQHIAITEGVLETDCALLMQEFFSQRR